MFATVRRYEGVTDSAEAAARVQTGFVPILKSIPGFVSYVFADEGDGVMISTSVFQDREGAEQSTLKAADWVRENLADLVPNPPMVTAGEVVANG